VGMVNMLMKKPFRIKGLRRRGPTGGSRAPAGAFCE